MNVTTSPLNLSAVLKLGAFIFIGWIGLWLAVGVALWLSTGTYEGMGFIFFCGVYGLGGAVFFALLGAFHYRYRVFSFLRCAVSAALASVLAFPLVWQFLSIGPDTDEYLGWVAFIGVDMGVLFGLLLRWLSGLLFYNEGESKTA